jgi:hypothetical protein
MRWILLGSVVAAGLVFVAGFLLRRQSGRPQAPPVAAKPLLSRPEQVLYGRLVRAFPGHIVLAQVALSQLLVVTRSEARGHAQSVANGFRQLVADFVICAPDFKAEAVIELDDRSHDRSKQRERDQRKDRFLQAAGIRIVRVGVANLPSEAELRALVVIGPGAPRPVRLAQSG